MVDPVQRVAGVQRVPCAGFIGIQLGSARNLAADEGQRLGLATEHAR